MDGVGRQEKNSIFVGDQFQTVDKALRRAVKFRAKLPVPFAVCLESPVQTGRLLRVQADKEFVFQIGQSHPVPGRQSVLLRKSNVTMDLGQLSRLKFAG